MKGSPLLHVRDRVAPPPDFDAPGNNVPVRMNECHDIYGVMYDSCDGDAVMRSDGNKWCDRHWANQNDDSLDEGR